MTPRAAGVRLEYSEIPRSVRDWVERELGGSVVSATTQMGGFSPGAAARLVTSRGRRAFVKAVGSSLNEESPTLFRREQRAMQSLPPTPHAPRLLGCYDDGAWTALLLEDIEGRMPGHPWTADDVGLVFDALSELGASLDPSPWPSAPRAEVKSRDFLSRWPLVRDDGYADLEPWVAQRLDTLVEAGERTLDAIHGDVLTHWDVRADNVLVTRDGRVVVVDWAHACLAAAWLDLVIAVVDLFGTPGIDVDALLRRYPATARADPAEVVGFVATVCGGLTWASRQPDPPGLPTLRAFQRHTADALVEWLRTHWVDV